MAQKKSVKKSVKATRVHEMIDTKTENLLPSVSSMKVSRAPMAKIALIVVVIGLVAIAVANKGLFVAAIVNGQPIWRWQMNQVMTQRFGQQTLDGMISEALIDNEAKKAGVTVTKTEIDGKVADLVKSFGGNVNIDDLLKYQGMTRAEFESQLRLQLLVEKLLGKDIVITQEDVASYIATNQATLTATDEAGLQAEAKQAIFSQKINDKLQTWFAELKAKAKILRFL